MSEETTVINAGVVTKEFGKDFHSSGGALTLPVSEVCNFEAVSGVHQLTHEDGWTIEGEVWEDYYTWVNHFEASHPVLGKVWGNFEDKVFADSEEAFSDFYEKHPPSAWDYGDI